MGGASQLELRYASGSPTGDMYDKLSATGKVSRRIKYAVLVIYLCCDFYS